VRFTAIKPGRKVVWAVLFDTDDPSLQAEMTITVSLEPAEGGTRVTFLSENLPPGLKPADNKEGSRLSLEKLAGWLAGRAVSRSVILGLGEEPSFGRAVAWREPRPRRPRRHPTRLRRSAVQRG
jgi:hypothetical protein